MEEPTAVPENGMLDGTDPQGAMPTTPATSETLETTPPPSIGAVQKELADLKAALKKANEEAKNHRLKANELDKLKAEIEAAKLSEQEKLQKQLADLKAQHDEYVQAQFETNVRHSVSLEAAKLGVDAKILDRVARFLDWEEITVDDEGQPTNIPELVAQLVNDIPGLRPTTTKSTPTSGGATNPARSTTSGQGTAQSYIEKLMQGKLSSDEYNALPLAIKTDIQKAMSGRIKPPIK